MHIRFFFSFPGPQVTEQEPITFHGPQLAKQGPSLQAVSSNEDPSQTGLTTVPPVQVRCLLLSPFPQVAEQSLYSPQRDHEPRQFSLQHAFV